VSSGAARQTSIDLIRSITQKAASDPIPIPTLNAKSARGISFAGSPAVRHLSNGGAVVARLSLVLPSLLQRADQVIA
jgi:hypothetical protein